MFVCAGIRAAVDPAWLSPVQRAGGVWAADQRVYIAKKGDATYVYANACMTAALATGRASAVRPLFQAKLDRVMRCPGLHIGRVSWMSTPLRDGGGSGGPIVQPIGRLIPSAPSDPPAKSPSPKPEDPQEGGSPPPA